MFDERRYINYLTFDECKNKFSWFSKNAIICDFCAFDMIDKKQLKRYITHGGGIRQPCKYCDLCGFSGETKYEKNFFDVVCDCGDTEYCNYCKIKNMNNMNVDNSISCIVLDSSSNYENNWFYKNRIGKVFIEHSNFMIGKKNNTEKLMWNYGVMLDKNLSNNMDLCRKCVEKFIKQGKIVSEKFISDTYNDQCRKSQYLSKGNNKIAEKLEKDKILFQVIRKEISDKKPSELDTKNNNILQNNQN